MSLGLNCEGGFPLILLQWNCREITENYCNSRPFQEICERAVRAVSTGLHLDDTDWGLCCRFVLSHSQVSQSCLAFLLQAGRFWCWLWNLRRALKELVKLTSEGSEHHSFFWLHFLQQYNRMSTEAFLPAGNARHFSEVGELFFQFFSCGISTPPDSAWRRLIWYTQSLLLITIIIIIMETLSYVANLTVLGYLGFTDDHQ